MKVAFVAGFFAPAEVVVKAHFLAPLHNRQLIWIPDAGYRRDPNIDLLVRELNQSLLNAQSPRLIHARPHDPEYNARLNGAIGAMLRKHPTGTDGAPNLVEGR